MWSCDHTVMVPLPYPNRKQLSSVAHRMTLSREARKRQGQGALVPRNYSPLTPIMQRLYSQSDEVI